MLRYVYRAVLAALAVATLVAPAGAWVRALDGSRMSADTLSLAAATPDGDLVTLGCPQGLVRLDGRRGHVRWWRDARDTTLVRCSANPHGGALVVAPDGRVVVATGDVSVRDGASGDVVWSHEVEGASDDDRAALRAVTVDPAGDVIAAGALDQGGDESVTDWNVLVEKLARADGRVRWRVLLDGSPAPPECDDGCEVARPADYANAIAVRGDRIIVAGVIERGGNPHFAAIAFDGATGAEAWRWESAASGEARAIAVADDGVIVAGQIDGAPAVVAFTADGALQWQASVAGADGAWRSMAITSHVLVTGRVDGRAAVASFTRAGARAWMHDESDAGEGIGLVSGGGTVTAVLALDSTSPLELGRWRVLSLDVTRGMSRWVVDPVAGRPVAIAGGGRTVFVAGTSETTDTFRDGAAIALSGDTGSEQWRRRFDATPRRAGKAEAVAVAANGDVVAAGMMENADTGFDFAVASVAARTGRVHWRRELREEPPTYSMGATDLAHAVRVDARGDVLVGGNLGSSFAVLKLDGMSGADHWSATSDPVEADGSVASLEIDGQDDVVAAGQIRDTFAVRKHDGATGVLQWEQRLRPAFGTSGAAGDVHVLPTGDVVAAGFVPDALFRPTAYVTRLDGGTGAVAWEQELGEGSGASVDARGGTLAAGGQIVTGLNEQSAVVASIDPSTGTEHWRAVIRQGIGLERMRTVLVDSRGDVIACTEAGNSGTASVRKLDRTTGDIVWERRFEIEWLFWSPSVTCALTRDDAVAVVRPVGPSTERTIVAAVLDGADGGSDWERRLGDGLVPWALAVDAIGNLFVGAERNLPGGFAVVGLDARVGSARPRRPSRGVRPDGARR